MGSVVSTAVKLRLAGGAVKRSGTPKATCQVRLVIPGLAGFRPRFTVGASARFDCTGSCRQHRAFHHHVPHNRYISRICFAERLTAPCILDLCAEGSPGPCTASLGDVHATALQLKCRVLRSSGHHTTTRLSRAAFLRQLDPVPPSTAKMMMLRSSVKPTVRSSAVPRQNRLLWL